MLALGDSGFLYRALRAGLPLLGFARYPVKFVILAVALAPLLAASGFAAVARQNAFRGRFERACASLLLLAMAVLVVVASQRPVAGESWRATCLSGVSRALVLVAAIGFAALWRRSNPKWRVAWGCALIGVFWADLATHVPRQNPVVRASIYAPGLPGASSPGKPAPTLGGFRAMLAPATRDMLRGQSISDLEENYLRQRRGLLANCNLLDEVSQVHGFFSLGPAEALDVTTVPYVQTNADFSTLLNFMGVSHITAPGQVLEWVPRPGAMPIVTAGQQPVFAEDRLACDAFSQTNVDLRHLVFLPPEARGSLSARRQPAAEVVHMRFSNQKVWLETQADAPTILVIAQSYYPAWRAYVDGRSTRIWRANFAFQALEVPAGRHQVRLVYEEHMLDIGAGCSALGIGLCATIGFRALRARRRVSGKNGMRADEHGSPRSAAAPLATQSGQGG